MSRIRMLWARVYTSLWFIPSLLTLGAVALAVLTIWIDSREVFARDSVIFAVGADGARGVLTTVAGSIITVTGVLFSITVVVLQLASSQFTPRVLRSFTEDRPTQLVLGVFIGTFTYSLLVLRTVRSSADAYDSFVPWLSVTTALLLALVSMGFLIYYINHIAHTIQAEVILHRVTEDALEIVDQLYPEEMGEPAGAAAVALAELPAGGAARLHAPHGGYIHAVDESRLLDLAEAHDLVLELQVQVGDFVIEGDCMARVWPDRVEDEVRDRLTATIHVGVQRTRYQDVERGLVELTDVGVRALSPGLNDPTTAIVCIDRLTQVLARLADRPFPAAARRGGDGRLRVLARAPSFEDLVRQAYTPLTHFGAGIPSVALRLVESVTRLLQRCAPDRREVLRAQLDRTLESARRQLESPHELARVERAARVGLEPSGVSDPASR